MTSRLSEVAALFLKLGFTAFGGPAAHTALVHDEVVRRRAWLGEEEFLDLVGASNLIPGPNSTELVIHLGYRRAGWPGLVVAGACFILPAMLIVLGLAWAYVRFGTLPEAGALLYGVQPVILAVIAQALWSLGRKAVKGLTTGAVGVGALALSLVGVNEILLLFVGGVALLAPLVFNRRGKPDSPALGLLPFLPLLPQAVTAAIPYTPLVLFLTFLKIGSVLYGSGYVLLAFLRADFVARLGWLSDRQLLDAIAVGQVTPGPLFTSATFVGYLMGGVPAALLATLGIFLPAFVFVALTAPYISRLRSLPWAAALLDGVNAASLGLMAAVTLRIAGAALSDWAALAIALVSLVLLLRFKVNATWLVLGGAALGILFQVVLKM
jgi:chromate transporter